MDIKEFEQVRTLVPREAYEHLDIERHVQIPAGSVGTVIDDCLGQGYYVEFAFWVSSDESVEPWEVFFSYNKDECVRAEPGDYERAKKAALAKCLEEEKKAKKKKSIKSKQA